MEFYIDMENGTGMKYDTKEEFIEELSRMIDDCAKHEGKYFSAFVDADANCFSK